LNDVVIVAMGFLLCFDALAIVAWPHLVARPGIY